MELLTPREFVITSLLVNRGELRYSEVQAAASEELPKGTINGTVSVLTRRGFLEKSRERQPNGTWSARYRITDHGRAAWTDFVDWVSCIAKGMKVKRRSTNPEAPRLPTADERRQLLEATNPNLGRLLRLVWAQPDVAVSELGESDVGDFDRAGELVVGPRELDSSKSRRPPRRRVKLTSEAAAICAEAAGLRRSGILFVTARGGRFERKSVTVQFRYLRERCGLPPHIKMRLKPGGWPVHAERDRLFLEWYEAPGTPTFHSPAAIVDRWNREHPDAIPRGRRRDGDERQAALDYVYNAIRRAKQRREMERSATSPAA